MQNKKIIGRSVEIDLLDLNLLNVAARVDSGASTSSIWASSIKKIDQNLEVVFFGDNSPYFNGRKVLFSDFLVTNIKSSMGEIEKRYKVSLRVKIYNHTINQWFTLANRSKQKFPILIGRNILKDRFLIDVSFDFDDSIVKVKEGIKI